MRQGKSRITGSRTGWALRILLAFLFAVAVSGTAMAFDSLPADSPKYARVKAVYDRVARAFGDGRIPPRLIVSPIGSNSRHLIAWSDPGTEGAIGIEADGAPLREGYIAIEEKVFDLLAVLGDDLENALAFLLGHELTHYYMRHGWVGDFGNSFASSDMGRKMMKAATYEEVIRRETEADYFGGFYGYLAGYDTLGVAPKALEVIYAAYDLPDKLPNYPSRGERKAIAARVEGNLRKMAPVFEAANRLLLLEKYGEAGRLFEHIAHTFPSRELFNNAGVAHALEALRLFRPGAVRFAYPFEFDAETRLRAKGGRAKGGTDEFAERRTRLLQKAAESFDKAIQRDRGYAVAAVNLAAVDLLLGDRDSAVILANRGMELASKGNDTLTLADALVARGIAYAEGGNRERAMVDMAAARNMGSFAAAHNLALLQGDQDKTTPRPGSETGADQRETIGGVAARDPFTRDNGVTTFSLKGVDRGEPTITVHSRPGKGREDTLVVSDGRLVRVVATAKGYDGETARGIRTGSTLEEVRQRYGDPSRVVTSPQGAYYLYRKAEVVFRGNREGKVSGWLIFSVQ